MQVNSSLEKTNIILPISPIFANRILSGEKKYEYRKQLCKKSINKIYIYATSPIKRIVGEVEVVDKLNIDKEKLWKKTERYAGITKEFYDKYFANQTWACAYKLGQVKQFNSQISLDSIGIDYAPQSYVYIGELEFYC